jgi:hypothetical protein
MESNSIEKYVYMVVIVVVLFQIVANTLPILQTSGNLINDTGVTLGSLFASNGVLWIVLLAGIFLMVIKSIMSKKK